MSGASAHKSRTQRQARRLAADLAKGRMPASTVDLEDYLDGFPDDVFVALDGFVEQVASSGADDALALGYLYLIQGQLERVRLRSERGYEDATRLIAEFQRAVCDLAVNGAEALLTKSIDFGIRGEINMRVERAPSDPCPTIGEQNVSQPWALPLAVDLWTDGPENGTAHNRGRLSQRPRS
jgi:hypothetical protein